MRPGPLTADERQDVLEDLADLAIYQGYTVIRGVVQDGYQEKKIRLLACEDVSKIKLLKNGKQVASNSSPYYVQHLTVIKTGAATWKVADVETTQLESLEGQPCLAA